MLMIDRNDYPALNGICWEIHNQFFEPKQVFELYEQKWCWVTMFDLTSQEKELIRLLAHQFGNGVLTDKSFKSDTFGEVINLDAL